MVYGIMCYQSLWMTKCNQTICLSRGMRMCMRAYPCARICDNDNDNNNGLLCD